MKEKAHDNFRNPFAVTHVPGLARLYLWAHNPQGLDFSSRLRRFLGQKLYRIVRRLNLAPSRGTFNYSCSDRTVTIQFNARNTQFLALYDDPYRYGYEIETSLLLDSLVDKDKVFYDIGSNWGYFSLFLASKPGYQGKIFAFEPFPPTFDDLRSTIDQAGLSTRVDAIALALSDFDGESFIGLPDGVRSGLASLSAQQTKLGAKTRVSKLDSLKLPPPFLMKIDAEGNEPSVIHGGHQTIRRSTPFIVFEHHRENSESTFTIFNELEDLGYSFYVPSLQFSSPRNHFRVTYGDDYTSLIERYGKYSLSLLPMKIRDRNLLPPQLNILAVHKRKTGTIKHLIPLRD